MTDERDENVTQKQTETRYTTPRARLSFPFLAEPRKPDQDGKKAMFEVSLIFDAAAQATPEWKAIREAVLACAKAKWPNIPPAKIAFPFNKGDQKTTKTGERMDGYDDGTLYFSAKSTQRVTLIDMSQSPVDGEAFYGGCYVRARVVPYAYDFEGKKKGVSFGLRGVQLVADGERFGGSGVSAPEEFGPATHQAGAAETPDSDLPF